MKNNISQIAISPNGMLLLAVDKSGNAILSNIPKRTILHYFNFKEPITQLSFSPNGEWLAVAMGGKFRIWRTPSGQQREFAPLVLDKTISGHTDDIVSFDWSRSGRFLLTAALDMTARVFDLKKDELEPEFLPIELKAHRHPLVGAYFGKNEEEIFTVGRNGSFMTWKCNFSKKGSINVEGVIAVNHLAIEQNVDVEREDGDGERESELLLHKPKVSALCYNREKGLILAGFTNGIFGMYTVNPFELIYSLGLSQSRISSSAINSSGEWLAFGCEEVGQLLVWEWQSESFILKQQGHAHVMTGLAYSDDGETIATGSDDGKVKLWNSHSGLSFATFTEHRGAVRSVEFTKNGKILVSASNDGTVRAYDLLRFRNFRIFTSPTPVQFISLAIDPSGEIVAAGTMDTFEIYLWSMQTGQLLEILSGHTGPICALTFDPIGHHLASGSWDKTVRLWEVFQRNKNVQTLNHSSDVLSMSFRPDGQEIATATLSGEVHLWDTDLCSLTCTMEIRRDFTDAPMSDALVNSISYSSDGTMLLVGGKFPFIGIYDVASRILLRRYPLTKLRRDPSARKDIREIVVSGVRASPTGRAWAALTLEGLAIFALDELLSFDPFDLEVDLTPERIKQILEEEKHYLKAFVMALRLNLAPLIEAAWAAIPPEAVALLVKDLPHKYLAPTLRFLATHSSQTHRIQLLLLWLNSILSEHALLLRQQKHTHQVALRALTRNVQCVYGDLGRVSNETNYLLDYFLFKAQ